MSDKHKDNPFVKAIVFFLRYRVEKEECLWTWRGLMENSVEIWRKS